MEYMMLLMTCTGIAELGRRALGFAVSFLNKSVMILPFSIEIFKSKLTGVVFSIMLRFIKFHGGVKRVQKLEELHEFLL